MAAAKLDTDQDSAEVVLWGVRAEFRTALRDEIEAARRAALSGAVVLVNGRHIAQVGGGHQYVFDVETALNTPGDAPGDLIIPGHSPLEVTIVSVNGLVVTLSLPANLGEFVPFARLQSNLTQLMRKLISRIENLGNDPNLAGDRIIGTGPVTGSPAEVTSAGLNAGQAQAVASALGRDTTFVWGPPGTGKTRTIGAIGAALFGRDRTLLMVSHTNTAVDQALLKIADELGCDHEAIAAGKVLRVGEPADPQLRSRLELLASTHIARPSEELMVQRENLVEEERSLTAEATGLGRRIAVLEWADSASGDIADMRSDLDELVADETELAAASTELGDLRREGDRWERVEGDVSAAVEATECLAGDRRLAHAAKEAHEAAEAALTAAAAHQADADATAALAISLESDRRRVEQLPELAAATTTARTAAAAAIEATTRLEAATAAMVEAERVLVEVTETGGLARRWRRLPSPAEQQTTVESLRARRQTTDAADRAAQVARAAADATLAEVQALSGRLAPHTAVPRQATADNAAADAAQARQRAAAHAKATIERLSDAEADVARLEKALAAFADAYNRPLFQVQAELTAYQARVELLGEETARTAKACRETRATLTEVLSDRLSALREWKLTSQHSWTAEAMLDAVEAAHRTALEDNQGVDVAGLRARMGEVNSRVMVVAGEITDIDEQLKQVETQIVAEAAVVATTLTRAYLRDSIQKRRFDTVILDEASMAPIPALWVAASLADANVVAVGDYKQLPPIVQASGEEAQRWLGRDVFEAAGITDHRDAPSHFVALTEQFRMHPDISRIANTLIYGGILTDGPDTGDSRDLPAWYNREWGHDHPVLLVDTGTTDAWVTSVARGQSSSRLNFLSATISVDLAEQLLSPHRDPHPVGDPARILIVAPYRPHAKLVELLLRDSGLAGEVRAGTAHTFQGAEADIVIVDLVNDEPHWKVGLFNPGLDDNTRRLFNVALTRTRHRLIVIGDFAYNTKNSRKAFLGRDLIPMLRDNPTVDALQVVPAGLAARAAKSQTAILGGKLEPDADRIVVTQEHFFAMLAGDLARARGRCVIYSPFITANRLAQLESQLKATVDAGTPLFVVTKPIGDRPVRDAGEYRRLEATLTSWGVTVVHKRNMHEKLVFVGDDVLWSGSLNPLSYADTQEVMERRHSRQVVADYTKTLRLDDLVGEYSDGPPACPICGGEIVAAEGKDEPYYWRCVEEHCYTRNVDGPRLTRGMIDCSNCGAPVEFGEWGDEYKWRCTVNARHRQSIARTHLRLPSMRALIPKRTLRQLDRQFGTAPTKSPDG